MAEHFEAYEIIGDLAQSKILIVADHASNFVPKAIDLGVDDVLLQHHIAVDIGVKEVAELMVKQFAMAGILARQSRLVIDLNRALNDTSLIPVMSDGYNISGNHINAKERQLRIDQFYTPYHQKIEDIINENCPLLILSLHSFTPSLRSDPSAKRPWEVGVLYGEHEETSKQAIKYLEKEGLIVGDQLPYSGKILNATMDMHAETHMIAYFGIEMRQDLVTDQQGCERLAEILGRICLQITNVLAS